MKVAGIYRIRVDRGTKPPAFYIGQAVNMHRRKLEHLRGHRTGELLLLAFRKYGPAAFDFSVLLVCTPDMLTMYEQAVLDCYLREVGRKRVLNARIDCVVSGLGCKHRPESIARMKAKTPHPNSIAAIERTRNTTRLDALRTALSGKPKIHSSDTVAKISASLTGKTQSEESNAKRRATLSGRTQTPEEIAKRVASRLANGKKMSPASIQKALATRAANKAKKAAQNGIDQGWT